MSDTSHLVRDARALALTSEFVGSGADRSKGMLTGFAAAASDGRAVLRHTKFWRKTSKNSWCIAPRACHYRPLQFVAISRGGAGFCPYLTSR
jgi:hypothetical protein